MSTLEIILWIAFLNCWVFGVPFIRYMRDEYPRGEY